RLLEAPLDRLGQLPAKSLELCEAPLEVGALHQELVEALLLGLVLLLRERVHLAELLAAQLEPLKARRELRTVVALRGLPACGLQTPLGFVALGLDARELDIEGARALGAGRDEAAELDLLGAETPQRRAEPCRPGRIRIDPLAKSRLDLGGLDR